MKKFYFKKVYFKKSCLKQKSTLAALLLAFALLAAGCGKTASDQPEQTNPSALSVTAQEVQETTDSAQKEVDAATGKADSPQGTEDGGGSVSGVLNVHFLDVGQGNSVLVENEGHYMLIDGGERDKSSYVVSYLKKQGVKDLDYVISSHYDSDHLNGVVGALNVFTCAQVIDADYTADSKVYQSFVSVVKEKGIKEVHPEVGATYELGDAMFTVVCPENYNYSDENDDSVGIRLTYGKNSFLILGDASQESEADMLASGETLKSDVYLASHHGSAGASSSAFLKAVDPSAVVISAGYGNSYGHPSAKTLDRIEALHADLYRTDLQGELIATSDGTTITWNQKPTTDYRSGDELEEGSNSKKDTASTSDASKNTTSSDKGSTSGSGAAGTTSDTYIVNTSTKKFHLPDCSSVDDMNDSNKLESHETKEELIADGYSPCKRCLK